MFSCLLTRNDVLTRSLEETGVAIDIFDELLPDTMPYKIVVDADGTLEDADFRADFYDAFVQKFQDRVLNCKTDYWLQKYKKYFTPDWIATVGKRYGIFIQDMEYDINYANLTETVKYEHTEPVRNASAGDTPSFVDETTRRFIQPAGPLGAANIIKDSMDSIKHPFTEELEKMSAWFVNEMLLESVPWH